MGLNFRILFPSLCDDGIRFFRASIKSLSSIYLENTVSEYVVN